jgi:hypothetical protein
VKTSNLTLSLCAFLNIGDQVSHPYRITAKIASNNMKKPIDSITAGTWRGGAEEGEGKGNRRMRRWRRIFE